MHDGFWTACDTYNDILKLNKEYVKGEKNCGKCGRQNEFLEKQKCFHYWLYWFWEAGLQRNL